MYHIDESIDVGGGPRAGAPAPTIVSVPSGRIVLGFLLFFTTVGLVFGVAKFYRDVHAPFAPKVSTASFEDAKKVLSGGTAQDTDALLKRVDTDGDGLSDWDEINLYGTSPYLRDSDSDGISDPDELKAGTDPNCPQGAVCALPATVAGDASTSGDASTIPSAPQAGAGGASGSLTDPGVLAQKLQDPASLTPEEIRTILLQSGAVDEAQLQSLDDTTLKTLFLQAFTETSASVGSTSSSP